MKILVIGSGGREHCLAWKISNSKLVDEVYVAPGNPGMEDVAKCVDIGGSDFGKLSDFAVKNSIDLTVVGPEAPLVEGIVDHFKKKGLKIFGPSGKAAMIEGSKAFTKRLTQKYGIPAAGGKIFGEDEYGKAKKYLEGLPEGAFPKVLKADGLAAGKGVLIAGTKKEALSSLDTIVVEKRFGEAGNKLIIEEFLRGFEVSILCLCDGSNILPMDLAQDYKRIYDGDKGKNTGGMGSYSPVPMVNGEIYEKILDKIIYPTYKGLKNEGIEYKGILYGGLMISDGNPYLLEYNCRFGDPETQAVLPRLNDDLVPLLMDCANGSLGSQKLSWDQDKSICVIMASKGYPESSSKGDVIYGLDKLDNNKCLLFHAGTKKVNEDFATNGGRVLGLVAKGPTFRKARKLLYSEIDNIKFEGIQYRKDIAKRVEEEK
ncbi:MAG: phosphoribosylamine--glycine ligase [Candidatus Humimicrobiaceae bacterium]